MVITAIKAQVKNSDRASIFIDGKYSFSLSLNELLSEKLKTGTQLDKDRLEQLKKLSLAGKLRGRALEWALVRPRSAREFRDYLFRKKADKEAIDQLINEFTDRKYLDEIVFTQWLVEMRRRKGKSERAIRAELNTKGISNETISEALKENSDELERLKIIVSKKSQLPRYKADPNKLIAYLARQGFSYDIIKTVLSEEASQ